MRVAGIAVKMLSDRRPAVRLVVLSDAASPAVVEASEEYTSDDVDVPTQLHEIAKAVGSRLQGHVVDRVIVRRADVPKRANNNEGPRRRLLAEGAATSAARAKVVDTRIGTGKDIGAWYGTSKNLVDDDAARLAKASSMNSKFVEATAAALAGLALPT